MAKYSITLNFFIPQEIVEKFKSIKIEGNINIDRRESNFCHCTVKAISHHYQIPKKEILEKYITESEKILKKVKSFNVRIKNIDKFSTAVFAKVDSKKLFKIHQDLFKVLPSSQPDFENEAYIPHVSLAKTENKNTHFSWNKNEHFGDFLVKEIQLMIRDENLKDSIIYHKFKLEWKPFS